MRSRTTARQQLQRIFLSGRFEAKDVFIFLDHRDVEHFRDAAVLDSGMHACIYLDRYDDEIDQWVIDAIKGIGLDTAKAVLNAPREMLVEKADLEEETVDHVLNVLRAEFEK